MKFVAEELNKNEKKTDIESRSLAIDENGPPLPYPKHVIFIIASQFCERFTYFGLRGMYTSIQTYSFFHYSSILAILPIYIFTKLNTDQTTTTVQYHAFSVFVYFMCIFGSITSDVWLGKYRAIVYLSIVDVFGNIIVTVGTLPDFAYHRSALFYIGLICVGIGSGGMKPCIFAFGGNQFKLSEQKADITRFFSILFFTTNGGAFLSVAIIPNLKAKLSCFNDDQCYPLAFGVLAIVMIICISKSILF